MFKLDSQKVVEALATYVEKNNTTLEQLAKQSGVSMDLSLIHI